MIEPVWEDEPDYLEGSYGDVPWFIQRQPILKHLCGYIVVNEHHPWYGQLFIYDGNDIIVHGGITYTDDKLPGSGEVKERANTTSTKFAGGWFIGFDCSHAWDYVPGLDSLLHGDMHFYDNLDVEYRTIEYVRAQCELLAQQAIATLSSRMLPRGDVIDVEST